MSGDVFALKGQCHKIFWSRVFHESSSPKPLKIALGQFQIFSKIRGDIRKSRYTIGLNDTVNFPLVPLVWLIPVANLHGLTKFVRIYLQNLQICDWEILAFAKNQADWEILAFAEKQADWEICNGRFWMP